MRTDMTESFFVGDAAGRLKNSLHRDTGDHSGVDLKFALNTGLRFYTPEQYFLGSDPNPTRLTGFNAANFVNLSRTLVTPSNLPIVPKVRSGAPVNKPELVIFVGPPASGKSTFYKQYFSPTRGPFRPAR
jgi:bifunctional polynucleotide phosphatase/kinase